ncbi:oxidoreductase domain protein [Sphingobium chlorophenolicum L-1]|uniref:Oxidoreductase domain protein n=1 Tax=Sphingobium chlorophenolicum L-1 TaxID=690566 RepID=F6ETQ3_SPHCR|nr:Gfo/Idh/MocA family oxidoreductase [Sphingobium chlorophenolicum]AEG49548.1 oxidoreductase domain protein [Sphingobium chlorophenolicum L-1]
MQERRMGLGIIGGGFISENYLSLIIDCDEFDLVAHGSRNADPDALVNGLPVVSVPALLDNPRVDLILNLVPAQAHAEVTLACLAAGKHVYSEKPLATTMEDADAIVAATGSNLVVACAPDTFLGGAHQAARHAVDTGMIGTPIMGSASFLSPGMEAWHPNPASYYALGGGVALDMGPYYVTQLVNLLGSVTHVMAGGVRGSAERTIGCGPRAAERVPVEVPTTVHGTLWFESGTMVSVLLSWDAWSGCGGQMELHGTEASLLLPDANWFGGCITHVGPAGRRILPLDHWPHAADNQVGPDGSIVADYRGIGLIDMCRAIRKGRQPRSSLALAYHVLEVVLALGATCRGGDLVEIGSRAKRPKPLDLIAAGVAKPNGRE